MPVAAPPLTPLVRAIFRGLLDSPTFAKRVLPHLKAEYFRDPGAEMLYRLFVNFYHAYRKAPTLALLEIEVDKLTVYDRHRSLAALSDVASRGPHRPTHDDALVAETERFCQNGLLALGKDALAKAKSPQEQTAASDLIAAATRLTFTEAPGTLTEDAESWHSHVEGTDKLPFDVAVLDDWTQGGLPNGTLNVVIAGTNVGKSLFLCHCAATALRQGKNVYYFSMEMSKAEVQKRIYANLLKTPMDQLRTTFSTSEFSQAVKGATKGECVVAEFPISSGNTNGFRAAMTTRHAVRPGVILVDYLTICRSARRSLAPSPQLYRAIAEEFRGLAQEYQVALLTAGQINRQGYKGDRHPDMNDIAQSMGVAETADLVISLLRSPDLQRLGLLGVKEHKTRYAQNRQREDVITIDPSTSTLGDVTPDQRAEWASLQAAQNDDDDAEEEES